MATQTTRTEMWCAIKRLPMLGQYARVEGSVIYFLFHRKSLVYVGQSVALASRIGQHVDAGRKFTRVLYARVDRERLTDVERAIIWHLRPPGNKEIRPPSASDAPDIAIDILRRRGP